MSLIKQAFTRTYSSEPSCIEVKNRPDSRAIVAEQAEGNALLQLGKYITQRDVDAKRQEVCAFKFSDR